MSVPEPSVLITEYSVSCLPDNNINYPHYTLTVSWRGDDRYAVMNGRRCLGTDGKFDYELSPSNREDDWLATHRFGVDEALDLARKHAPLMTCNGYTVADALGRPGGGAR